MTVRRYQLQRTKLPPRDPGILRAYRFPQEQVEKIDRLARRLGINKTDVMKLAINALYRKYVEEGNDIL